MMGIIMPETCSVYHKEIQLDATQWFIELMIRSTRFRHYYAHRQELKLTKPLCSI